MNKIGKLKVVSKIGGLKFEGEENWVNADKNYQKDSSFNVEAFKKFVGKKVEIQLNEGGYYTSIIDLDVVDEITKKEPQKKLEETKESSKEEKKIAAPDGTRLLTHEDKIMLSMCAKMVYDKMRPDMEKAESIIFFKKETKALFKVTKDLQEEVAVL